MTVGVQDTIEARVQEIGRELLAEARDNQTRSFQDELLLTRLMRDESARVQALRFVDVLPTLQADPDLVAHLQQYFEGETLPVPAPGVAAWALDHAGKGVPAMLLAKAVRAGARMLAERFIAGHDVASVLPQLEALRRKGMGFTLDLLGETTLSEADALQFQQHYVQLLRQLEGPVNQWPLAPGSAMDQAQAGPRLHLSIKLSGLYSQMDPLDTEGTVAVLTERLRPILAAARGAHAFITVDMEHYNFKDLTLQVFRSLLTTPEFADWPHIGIALQAYLRDTPKDIEALIAWARQRGTPITVRLVRGAYWDSETLLAGQNGWPVPVWSRKDQTDQCYEACLVLLMGNAAHVQTAVATHNVRSVALALALAEKYKLIPGQYEFQMLYGMADHLKTTLVERGQQVRVYTPFGELLPGMAYFVRRLLENTSSQSFVRMSGVEDQPADTLLAAPVGSPAVRRNAGESSPDGETSSGFRSEPLRRFVAAHERQNFKGALAAVRQELGRDYPAIIGGQAVTTGAWMVSTNPARPEQVVGRVAAPGADQAPAALAAAQAAFPAWAATPAHERAEFLFRAADDMRARRDRLAALEVYEAGKPWREADADVVAAIDFLEYYGHEMLRLAPGLALHRPGETNHYEYFPRGLTAVLPSWDSPLASLTGMVAAAIVAGNTVVLKPAPQTPVTAWQLMDVWQRVGLPAGVANFLPGGDATGLALAGHPDVAIVAFAGAQAAGCKISEAAAHVPPGQDHLKRVIAALGGKNAIIVDGDADLGEAAVGTVASAFGYAGQKSSAASRVIVLDEIYDGFLKRLIEATRSLRVGPPEEAGTFVGPVIDEVARARIRGAIAAGKKTARCVLETDVAKLAGSFVGPTIFADVDPDSALAQEEIFGPVLAVIRARDFSHALEIANATRYALAGGVYSRSPANLARARREFQVGNLYLNRRITDAVVGHQPFGGMKMSGLGSKAGGPDYLRQFMEARTITENTLRRGFAPSDKENGTADERR